MSVALPPVTLLDEITDFMASTPTLDEIINFRPSEQSTARLHTLLEKNRESVLSAEEQAELDEILRLGRLLNMLTLKVRLRLAGKT